MHAEPLDNVPMLDEVLDLQRALSASQDVAELVYTFADRFYRLYGFGTVLGLDVNDLAAGEFRVMDFVDATRGLSLQTIRDNARWDQDRSRIPIERGGVVGGIAQGSKPTLTRGIQPADDAILRRYLDRVCDIVSVPIFKQGELVEWFLVFREPGLTLEPMHVRLLVTMLNMFSRSIMLLRLHRDVATLNDQLDGKLREVARVQRSILPQALPKYDTLDIAAEYRPSYLAGGDYYDFRTFEDGALGIVIADVSGHGPGAAVVMAMLRTVMSIDRVLNAGADRIANSVNRLLWDGLTAGTFVTAFFLKLDPVTGRIDYANAGHWPALVRKPDGTIQRLNDGSGPPIGMLEDLDVPGGTAQLEPGDALLLYTDGITETFGPDEKLFGEQRLIDTLKANPPATARGMIDTVCTAVDDYAQGRRRADDQCLVALRYLGRGAGA